MVAWDETMGRSLENSKKEMLALIERYVQKKTRNKERESEYYRKRRAQEEREVR